MKTARQLAKSFGALGLTAGILYAVLGAVYDAITNSLSYGTLLAFFAIIGMPLIFATVGLIVGATGSYLLQAKN